MGNSKGWDGPYEKQAFLQKALILQLQEVHSPSFCTHDTNYDKEFYNSGGNIIKEKHLVSECAPFGWVPLGINECRILQGAPRGTYELDSI